MTREEMAQLREIKSCDYKHCSKKGGIYIGNFMDYSNDWLAEREPTEPTVPVFVCEKHAKKIFKLLNINKDVL